MYKYGDKVKINIPESTFYNEIGVVIGELSYPFKMYKIEFFQSIRVGVIEKYLEIV